MKLRLPLLSALLFLLPLTAQARPVSAVLYPSGALVTEEEMLRPENGDITLLLPAGADEGSLEFSLSKGRAEGSIVTLREGQRPRGVARVREQLNTLENEAALLEARQKGVAEERRYWSRQGNPSADEAGQEKQAKNIAARLEELARKDAGLAASLRELSARRRALEQRLEALGNHNESMLECTLHVHDTGTEPVRVRWSYYLNDAGWQPRYRVQAMQDAGRVVIAMEAVLRQGSGSDWEGVETLLSSAEDFRSVTPPALPQWIVGGERAPALPKAVNVLAARAAAAGNEAADMAGISVQSHATGLRWNLGRVDVPAGARATRPVDSHEFEAAFFRLVRPTEDGRAWIMATLPEDALPLLPAGQAVFVVDGVENARGIFRMTPGERELSFGVDQLITVKKHELPAEGTDVPAGMKARQWRWKAEITNGHDSPVDVRVEAAAPVLRDACMSAREKSRPAADADAGRSLYEWLLEVPAHKSVNIVHEVVITAPAEASASSK